MELYIQGNGLKQASDTVKDHKYGLMVPDMTGTGKMIWQMGEED